ncbi:MAG TPA: hypothetical protein VMN78_13420 [Longimicrobiales bacterium]|nr:hypothetical protein [Longimicrobiales bacterium]
MSLRRERRFFRHVCGVLFGVQLMGAGLVPLAHARVEAAFEWIPLHIEASDDGSCDHSHDHQHCALCQHLAHGDGALMAGSSVRAPAEAGTARCTAEDQLPLLSSIDSPRSRAPPPA